MFSKRTWLVVSVLIVLSMALSACGTAATTAPAATEAATTVAPTAPVATTVAPTAAPFIIGILLVNPYNDSGWSQATYTGAMYVASKLPNTKVIYADKVNTGDNPNTTSDQFAEKLLSEGAKVIFFDSDSMSDGLVTFTTAHPDVPVIWLSGDYAWKDGKRYNAALTDESDRQNDCRLRRSFDHQDR